MVGECGCRSAVHHTVCLSVLLRVLLLIHDQPALYVPRSGVPDEEVREWFCVHLLDKTPYSAARTKIFRTGSEKIHQACLQPATNTQNSKPRPPTTNAKEN